jgi:putative transposase
LNPSAQLFVFAVPRKPVACWHDEGTDPLPPGGCFHFVTFSCYHRLAYLGTATARRLFERSLEAMRKRYDFVVCGYVVMPEHVHLLLSEPKEALLSKAIQALKLSVSAQSR